LQIVKVINDEYTDVTAIGGKKGMSISRYDPFRESLSLRRAMDQLFEQSFIRPRGVFGAVEEEAAIAPMDVCETDQGYEVCMALPGVKPDDVELTVQQNILTVRGRFSSPLEETTQEKQQAQATEQGGQKSERKTWIIREIPTGTFQRSITFDRPIDVDKIRTNYQNGMLMISLPVSQASMPRRITLSASQSQDQPKPVQVDAKQ
jgi:HSP20 family protein